MKTIRFGRLILSLSLLFFLAISTVALQYFVKKCIWWSCAPVRKFTVYDLSLPDSFFPTEAGISPLYTDKGIVEAVEEVRSTSSWKGGGAIYKVLQFATERQASKWYSVEVDLDLFTETSIGTLEFSDIKFYKNSISDQSKINCGYVLQDFRCIYWAQYQEFFIFFSSSIDSEKMRPEDFAQIIDYLNERMGSLLN